MQQPFIIATAGHIDHGKTTLIKALTTIQTDTAPEEKRRGLTINLGFAYLDLADGTRAGIIDVPGHERFVKNMLAGAIGVDLGLLVIDASEGVMPQTVEHIDILTLLGVKHFIIVLTKVDGLDPDLLELVRLDVEEFIQDTPLEETPIVETDALNGVGLEKLKEMIEDFSAQIKRDSTQLPARLNVDRSFHVKGIGTIVTGTLLDGQLSLDDEVYVYPANTGSTIRSIQIHEQQQTLAYPGNRTALNLTHVKIENVPRGSVISHVPLSKTYMLDVKLTALSTNEAAIRFWDRVHLYSGTTEVLARVVPLEEDILPGTSSFAQLRLEEPLYIRKGDRFIIRQFSPLKTLGGGQVIDAHPAKHAWADEELLTSFQIKESGSVDEQLMDLLNQPQQFFLTKETIIDTLHVPADSLEQSLKKALKKKWVVSVGDYFIARQVYDELQQQMIDLLDTYHDEYPHHKGMPLETFRAQMDYLPLVGVNHLIDHLVQKGRALNKNNQLTSGNFVVILTKKQTKLHQEIVRKLEEDGINPPTTKEIFPKEKDYQVVFEWMKDEDELYQLDRDTVVLASTYQRAKEQVVEYLRKHEEIELAECRDLLQTNRKAALRLLDELDRQRVTLRKENKRTLHPNYQ